MDPRPGEQLAAEALLNRKRRRSRSVPPRSRSRKTRIAFPRTAVIWSPQEVESRRKTATRSEARSVSRSELGVRARMFQPTAARRVRGIKEDHVIAADPRGCDPPVSSTRSPCGSRRRHRDRPRCPRGSSAEERGLAGARGADTCTCFGCA